MTVTDAVHDIAFAPNLGRSFHVLAIATKDVRIFKLVPMRSFFIHLFSFLNSFLPLSHMRPEDLLRVSAVITVSVWTLLLLKQVNKTGRELPRKQRKASRLVGPKHNVSMAAFCSAVLGSSRMESGSPGTSQTHVWKRLQRRFQCQVCVLIAALRQTGRRARPRDLPGWRCRLWLSLTTTTLRCGAWAGTSPARCWPPRGTTAASDSGKVPFRPWRVQNTHLFVVNASALMLLGWLCCFCSSSANYMDNWKCTGILKGDGSPLSGSSGQPTAMSTIVGSSVHTSQNALNGMSAGR